MNFRVPIGQERRVDDPSSDADVIRVSLHDHDAFVVIFDRHFDSICRYLVRRAGTDEGSELASEVFVRAYEQRSRYDLSRADAAPWLYGIATNVFRRQRRSDKRRIHAYTRVRPGRDRRAEGVIDMPELGVTVGMLLALKRSARRLQAEPELALEQTSNEILARLMTVRAQLQSQMAHALERPQQHPLGIPPDVVTDQRPQRVQQLRIAVLGRRAPGALTAYSARSQRLGLVKLHQTLANRVLRQSARPRRRRDRRPVREPALSLLRPFGRELPRRRRMGRSQIA